MNKYSKYAGVALGLDLAFGGAFALVETKDKLEAFGFGSIISLVVSTLPAIGANVVDKYVNQKISDNKYFQYGATALEAGLINVGIGEAWYDFDGYYITRLTSSEFSLDSCLAKLWFASTIVQGLLFKYILSEEQTNEFGNGAEDGVLFRDAVNDNSPSDTY